MKKYYRYLEKQVRSKSRELEKFSITDRQKDDFIAMAAHELKTPITSIKAFMQVLEAKIRSDGRSDYNHYLLRVRQQTEKLIKLISDLLDISKINAGQFTIEISDFDFSKCLIEAVEEVKFIYATHRIECTGKSDFRVKTDRHRLNQLLINLMSNAIKYSPRSGRIIVNTSLRGGKLKVNVTDFGIGIAKKDRDRIFEKFYRVSGKSERTFAGMGIGLSISREIVRLLKGNISFKSRVGKGSVFSFVLPVN